MDSCFCCFTLAFQESKDPVEPLNVTNMRITDPSNRDIILPPILCLQEDAKEPLTNLPVNDAQKLFISYNGMAISHAIIFSENSNTYIF